MNLLKNIILNENKNIFIFYFLFFISSYICLTNCLIEIPFRPIDVKNIPKYKNIEVKERSDDSTLNKSNTSLFYIDGKTTINQNYLFLASIKIGSQPFNLLLDTGSNILWVAEVDCIESGKIPIKRHYDPSKSSTKVYTAEDFRIIYGTGSCQGFLYYEYAEYINNKSFKIKLGVAKKTDFSVYDCDGIIGLGHDYSDKNDFSFIHMLKKSGITDSTKFSFKFIDEKSGKLIIGEHDDFSSSNAITCPLKTLKGEANSFWVCEVDGFGLINKKEEIKSLNSYNIIFDTGTNYILLPLQYYNDMKDKFKNFGCTTANKDKDIQLICSDYDNAPDFTFRINGNILTLSKYYTFYRDGSKYYSSILFVKDERYIIGSPFFVGFHTLFDKDNEKLHFYPEKNNIVDKGSNTSSIVALIVVLIILILLLAYIIYRYILWRRAKRELQDIPSSNYGYYL